MATRLEISHGSISERDRLSTSADTVSVTRPSTGSKTRSKGVLFIVVGIQLLVFGLLAELVVYGRNRDNRR